MTFLMRILPLGILLMVFTLSIPTGMFLTSLNTVDPQSLDTSSFDINPEHISSTIQEITFSGIINPMFLGFALLSLSVSSYLYWKRR